MTSTENNAGTLVNKDTNEPVLIGDVVRSGDDEYTVRGWRKPHKISSTGRVFVEAEGDEFERSYFPGVFNLVIINYD